jgi:hypothetical protein
VPTFPGNDTPEQAMDIMRAKFPELAKSYEPETVVEPDPDNEA